MRLTTLWYALTHALHTHTAHARDAGCDDTTVGAADGGLYYIFGSNQNVTVSDIATAGEQSSDFPVNTFNVRLGTCRPRRAPGAGLGTGSSIAWCTRGCCAGAEERCWKGCGRSEGLWQEDMPSVCTTLLASNGGVIHRMAHLPGHFPGSGTAHDGAFNDVGEFDGSWRQILPRRPQM